MKPWLIYGANGYTGRLVAREAKRRGETPLLAGRNEGEIRSLARELELPYRAFALDRAGTALGDVGLVLHCAGPFSATSRPMVEACLCAGAHYLDITGEIPVIEWVLGQRDRARQRGVVLMPGVGFDVVPSDCLAKRLSDRLPGATELELAFTGSSRVSPGTLKTMIERLPEGGMVRRNGRLERVGNAHRTREVAFPHGRRTVTAIAWGDVSSAWYTTGIPNITTYTVMPASMRRLKPVDALLRRAVALPPVQRALKTWVEARVKGPTEAHRKRARMYLWGRAARDGESVEETLTIPEGYTFTALSAVTVALAVRAGEVAPGAWTPAGALGPDLVERCLESFPGTLP